MANYWNVTLRMVVDTHDEDGRVKGSRQESVQAIVKAEYVREAINRAIDASQLGDQIYHVTARPAFVLE